MSVQPMYSILIVDDNPNNLFTLRALLENSLNVEVIQAESGFIALEKISRHKIDLIILDIQMPDLDGFEVARLIHSRKKYQDVPVIFLTAVFKSEEFKQRGFESGAIDYLTKPIDETILITRIKGYLRVIEAERAVNRKLEVLNAQLQAEIEERKRIEDTLSNERNLLRTLIDHLPDLIYVKDIQNRFVLANAALVSSFGASEMTEILGKTDFDWHPHELAEQYIAAEQAILQSGVAMIDQEQQFLDRQTGNLGWLLTTKVPFYDHQGNLTGIVGLGRNITARKLTEQELERLNRELKEASQHKSDFLSSMSHELRTPLNALIGYLSLALTTLKKSVPVDQLDSLSKANQAARVLLQLINDVLDFSKIEAGKMDVFVEEVELSEIIEDVVMTAEGLLLNKPVELRAEIDPDLPLLQSDYTKIKQMLNNLIGNAIKFTSAGFVAVRAQWRVADQIVRIEVEDSGPGIAPDKIGTLFESFQQADGSIKKKFGGTGLGLAITRRFCELLGFEIGIHSVEGQGSVFWLQIPVPLHAETPTAQDEEHAPPHHQAAADISDVTPPDDARPFQSVLVVDDDDMNLQVVGDTFEIHGYTMYRALSAAEGIRIAQNVHPDVILMDLAMPDIDGLEATQMLKRNPLTVQIPVIACSANVTSDIKERALQAGCIGFISRPIMPSQLIEHVTRLVAHAAQEHE